MVTIDYASQEGGETYSESPVLLFFFVFFLKKRKKKLSGERVPNWVFYPAIAVFAFILFLVFKIAMAYLRDVRESSQREAERLAKKAQKKVDKSRVPVAPLKKSPNPSKK